MKKKHLELLTYMLNHTSTVTSKELAAALSISVRSVKNYVNEINSMSANKVILSSKQGYSIQPDIAAKLISQQDDKLPQTSEERAFFIVKQLMLEHTTYLDLFDICEELYVSYSTIKADIAKMNKMFANFHVSFQCENDVLHITGSEKAKRKLVSYVMYEETNQQFIDVNIIRNSFTDISIEKVSSIIRSTFQNYNYYINDFSFVNLLLHFAIIIDRIREGNMVEKQSHDFEIESEIERNLVHELCGKLENEFQIQFNRNEQFEVYMLFKTNANYSMPSSEDNLKKLVGEELLYVTKDIVHKVNDHYYINLSNENFITPFSLHLKNLLLRARNKTYTKNPMADTIKNSCPSVYDIAIFISQEITNRYNIRIHEDEVTFLALHIGADIERQKTNDTKIQCVFLSPNYMTMTTSLYNRLLIDFGNQINIKKTISYEYELNDIHYDMVISTIPLQTPIQKPVCQIPPFISQFNRTSLQQAIDTFRINKKNYILKKNFHDFFSEELFIANPQEASRDEVIDILTKDMMKLEYVNHDFRDKVMIRERAASTAFVNIAIPHSMEMEAIKTCIGVAISTKGIHWDNQLVHVVLLVAINKIDKMIFHDLYEALVMLFSEEKVIEQAKNCTTFRHFEDLISSSIITQEEII